MDAPLALSTSSYKRLTDFLQRYKFYANWSTETFGRPQRSGLIVTPTRSWPQANREHHYLVVSEGIYSHRSAN